MNSLFNIFRTIVIIGLLLFFSFGCMKKEIDEIDFAPLNPTIAAPLLNTNMGLDDMVAIQGSDLDITVDPDGFLRFIYFEELAAVNATDYISVPDQSFNENINGPGTTGFGTQNITINNTTTFPFTNGEEMYQAIIKSPGDLNLQFSHNYQHDVSITITFPTALLSGVPLTRTYNLNYTGLLPVTANDNIDLDGYDIDLTNGNTTFNTLPYTIDVTVTEIVPNPVVGIESITANADLTNLEYSYLRGYMGQFDVAFNLDTVDIDIFDNNPEAANMTFADPKARFYFNNSFGIPLEVSIDTLVTELNNGTPLTITGTYDDLPIAVDFPTSGQVGQTIESDFTIDKNNSTIDNAFNPAPNKMFFAVTTNANPGAGKPENFVTDSSKLIITGEAEIPMDGTIKKLSLSDTITDMELPDTTEDGYNEINFVTFKIETDNGFPLDARIQGYFLDSNDVVIDSLFYNNDNTANSGLIDGSGKVFQSTKTFIETTIDKARYKNIMFSKTMVILGTVNTTNNGTTSVKIFNTYFINIQMGVKVDGTIDIDDL